MRNRVLKIVTILIVAILGVLGFSNVVHADFEIFQGEVVTEGKRFKPQYIEGEDGIFYCIWGHGSYKASMSRGYTPGTRRGKYYEHNGTKAPWSGNKISMVYTKGDQLEMENFQDAAYILAFGDNTMDDAYAIWSTSVNFGQKEAPNEFGLEAAAYKAFYQSIHSLNSKDEGSSGGSSGESSNKPGYKGYPSPTIADVRKVAISEFTDADFDADTDNSNVTRDDFIRIVTEIIEAEWWDNYDVDLSSSELNDVRDIAAKYYDQFILNNGEEEAPYPMPTMEDIESLSKKYVDDMANNNRYISKENYIGNVYVSLQLFWYIDYGMVNFTPEEEVQIKQMLSQYYDTIPYERPVVTEGDIREFSQDSYRNKEEYITQVYSQLAMKWDVHYNVQFTASEEAQIKQMLSEYYDANIALTKGLSLTSYSAQVSNLLSTDRKVTYVEYRYDAYEDDYYDEYYLDFDEYYDDYDDEDEYYYDEDEEEYPEPSMSDIHRIVEDEFTEEDFDEDFDEDADNSNVTRDDFIIIVRDIIEAEWWDNYEVELNFVELDNVEVLAGNYFDRYITGRNEFDETNYVTDEPTVDEVHSAVKAGGYGSSMSREAFIDAVTNRVANDWNKKYHVLLTDSQIEEVRELAREYYDDYIATSKNYDDGYKDKFKTLIKDNTNTNDLRVRVKRSDDSYIVGPYKVSYPNGEYEGVNKFSWISNVKIADQTGAVIADVLDGDLEIIDKNGNLIYDTDKDGNNLNVPKNGEDFYVKFHSDDALDIYVTIDFGYLESIDTEAYRYNGTFYNWYWEYEYAGIHREWCDHDDYSHRVYCCDKYYWVLQKEAAATSQLLMDVISAVPEYKDYSYTLLNRPRYNKKLDMTMSIDGKVFLDRDQGKVNAGNNELDNGEGLEGIDVWLYRTDGQLIGVTLTDSNGYYKFDRLNAQKQYYVQFAYNGMLYTNVEYRENGEKASKATEIAHGHSKNRTEFNNKFAEVGSYPANYTTKDCITGATIKNKVYKQDEIVELFKEVAKAMKDKNGNKVEAYKSVINKNSALPEIKEKVQFIADIRINAYTVTNYSRHDAFMISDETERIGNTVYRNIYYEQNYVNLGIKARPTFDMALYKDVFKADVLVNGKTETYTYDKRTSNGNGFSIGVSESDYLNGIRGAYLRSAKYDNIDKIRNLETDTYDLNIRSEEVANGQSSNYNLDVTGKVNKNYQLNSDYENLKTDGTNKDDRLKIYVTYKIAIRNQSGITGAVTEVVDYFDPNYAFIEAFVGDKNGNRIGTVTKYDTSKYGKTDYKSTNGAYTTIYLRPDQETRLTSENREQYIYVVLQLVGPNNDVGTLLSERLLNKNELSVTNLAEINGYKTYDSTTGASTPGLLDIDSVPGNLNLSTIKELTTDEIKKHESTYEDDTSKAPALIYKLLDSRTIEGTVYEDSTGKDDKVYTGKVREGNGKLDKGEVGINGVIVQLIEIKNGEMIVRATTTTNADGWYGFTGFLPGNYTIRYIYGSDDNTAMTTTSKWFKGLNEKSYNGQDYQSTTFGVKQGVAITDNTYKTDTDLINRYRTNHDNKDSDESTVNPNGNTTIKKYQDNYYWYTVDDKLSDAKDDEYRRQQVIDYARTEYGTAVANHKAQVFNAYLAEQPDHITQELNRKLANELESRNYRFAYTAEMPIEVEYATQIIAGTGRGYEHKITNVDFGIVERPKAKVELTKNLSHIKVTTTDGTVLFDTDKQVENLSWRPRTDRYKVQPPIQIIMDEELISGATVEITYKITITNNGEVGKSPEDGENGESLTATTRILDYVDNNLNFNIEDNLDENGKALWKVVQVDDMQNATKATFINNSPGANELKLIDLSTQQTLLQTTEENPLSRSLKVGEKAETTLTLRKVLAAESTTDQLTYDNIMETIEIDNTVGRYDHTSVPGNQDPEKEPTEDDTFRSETVTILPPFGSQVIYYVIGITVLAVLGIGIFVIKKYVVDSK